MDKEIVVPDNALSSGRINQFVVVPANEYDCVIWDEDNLPLDVIVPKAYRALKVGGIFIVQKCESLNTYSDILLSLFEIKETDAKRVVFVKEK